MNYRELKKTGHFPTLVSAFLYFDYSFMVWTLLGALGTQIAAPDSLNLTPQQKSMMVAVPILSGAILRLALGFLVDRIGAKKSGILAQLIVIVGLSVAWIFGLKDFAGVLMMGMVLGVAGGSFAIALPQAGRWYPPNMQGLVLGLAGAGNIGVVIDSIFAPRLAAAYGWNSVFGFALIPAVIVLAIYIIFSKEPVVKVQKKKLRDYVDLFGTKDTHWFCFYYTVSFGGFVGLASSLGMLFNSQYGLGAVHAGDLAALCTAVGALARPIGGGVADRIGGIRSLYAFYTLAGISLILAGLLSSLFAMVTCLFLACAAFGMANGSVFQLLPQRFAKEIGLMTGLVGAGGGLGGFALAGFLGISRQYFGNYSYGLWSFASLCFLALIGLSVVKKRWRTTWGAAVHAQI